MTTFFCSLLQMLDKLQEWRMEGGPKLGVVVDYDERLTQILENLDMMHYFDVVVSTRYVCPRSHPATTSCADISVHIRRNTERLVQQSQIQNLLN